MSRSTVKMKKRTRKIEIISRIEAQATASREEGSSYGGDGSGGARSSGGSDAVSVSRVEVLSGSRGGRRGSSGLPERAELPELAVGLAVVADCH
nr:hypothetical protein Iba_chr01dCG7640 [Ipomoea batatas]